MIQLQDKYIKKLAKDDIKRFKKNALKEKKSENVPSDSKQRNQ
jgi:hypothetical protein